MSEKENSRGDCAVKIAVRERPFIQEELGAEGIEKYSGNIIIVEDRPFGFDHVFEQSSTQEEVFEAIGRPLVEKMLSGFNCSLLAYGQSGNGKTYTMGLNGTSEMSSKEAGIIIRTLRCIFESVHSEEELKLEVSFIEIYNEKVYDLLSPNFTEAEKTIRGPFKKLFTKRPMNNEHDAQEILAEAYRKRHVRPTKINLSSSRSHAVFTIYATIKTSDFCTIKSELNLVDLAGSEGVRKTGHHGQALAEGVNINQGLLSVGRILQAIAKGDKVIPYRESVLTRVLQESLNRNCFLTLLACVSPSKLDSKETLSTLRFAENVGTLKNNPKINVIMNEITMARRKTPTKQMFTPRPTSSFKPNRATMNTTLKKKCLNFPEKVTSTARKESATRRPSYYPNSTMVARPTEQEFSFAGNISTSTFVNHPMDTTQMNFSPVIRKCMSTFESRLDEKISAAMNDIASKLINTSTVVVAAPDRREVETKRRKLSAPDDAVLFKVPQIPQNVGMNDGDLANSTFDLGGCEGDDLNVSSSTTVVGETSILRRSTRIQSLNESQMLMKRELERKKHTDVVGKPSGKTKKKPHAFVKNAYLASYFRLSTPMEAADDEENGRAAELSTDKEAKGRRKKKESAADTHAKEVLNIVNNGNLKELQILPLIGLKTAYQIMSYRATKGKLKSFKDLKKLNWTDKKLDKFLQANYVS